MSTVGNPLAAGREVTGNESQDQAAQLEALVQSKLQEMLPKLPGQEQQQQSGNTPPAGPLVLTVAGKEYTFNSPQEASLAVEQAMAQVAAHAQQQQQQRPQEKQAEPVGKFDRERFANTVAEDPLKGMEYAISHLVFGQEVPNAGAMLRNQLGEVSKVKQQLAAYQFKEMVGPEFSGSQQDIAALEQVRQELGLQADNPTAWEAAYAVARSRGLIQARTPQQTGQQTGHQQQQSPYAQPTGAPVLPPSMGRYSGNEPPPGLLERAEQLPTDKLEQLLYSMQGQLSR